MFSVQRDVLSSAALDECLKMCSEGMVYHLDAYSVFLQTVTGGEVRVLSVRDGDEVLGFFRYFRKEDFRYGVVFNSSPWFGSHGGCVLKDGVSNDVRVSLLESFAEDIGNEKSLLAACISLSPREFLHKKCYEKILGTTLFEPRVAQIVRLPEGQGDIDDSVFKVMRSKTRNLVRKSLNQKFRLEHGGSDADWKFLMETHEENMRCIQGMPKSLESFKALREILGDRCRLSLAFDGDIPVAAMLNLEYGPWVEYFLPVIKQEYRSRQPLSFLIYKSMCEAVSVGRRYWNFGGTRRGQDSLHHFKAGWGAQDYEYGYVLHATAQGMELFKKDMPSMMNVFSGYYLFPGDKL